MPIDLDSPDLEVSLSLDDFAPRAARYHVTHLGHPSPDLRDAVALLTSELVSRAVQQSGTASSWVTLRAWMPFDLVRVELRGDRRRQESVPPGGGTDYDLAILDQVADRWSIDASDPSPWMWFEIDRVAGDLETSPDGSAAGRPPCKSSA